MLNSQSQIADVGKNDMKLKYQKKNEDMDDEPMRGTRSLFDIYQSCNE